ncbi:MAG: hypothetical protein JSS32_03355 [Verrucomicrobia bacterium]|nr:hypothetical protein [Verrucomicrobiota bacterium]
MKKLSLSKTLLLTGSMLALAFSCTCQKKEAAPQKGPQQSPFENCECEDCECEEGATAEPVNKIDEAPAAVVQETAPVAEEILSVTPVVIEAVKVEAPVAVETPAVEKIEAVVTETVAAPVVEQVQN